MKRRIDEELFNQIKLPLRNRLTRPRALAKRFDISLKTCLMIKGSATYLDYKAQSKAQHPDNNYSLRDEVLYLHQQTFKKDNTYIPPPTARQAVVELQRHA